MSKIIAVDFDGTLCENAYPNIGNPNRVVINKLLEEQRNGAKIILWTCRQDELLSDAVVTCGLWGIKFDAVNENLPELISIYKNDCRKISATEYWDDRAVNPLTFIDSCDVDNIY